MDYTITVTADDDMAAIRAAVAASGAKDEQDYIAKIMRAAIAAEVQRYVNVCPTCKKPL